MDTTPTHPSTPPPAPINTTERIDLLDIIRGFALGGVFFSNIFMWFSGRFLMPPTYWKSHAATTTQTIITLFFGHLVFHKFITIFTFLFGFGLAVQFSRAEARDDSPKNRYMRRAFIMLLMGIAHAALIWYGDILHVYALLGFGLLLLRRASNKTILITGVLLATLTIPVAVWLQSFAPRLWSSADEIRQSMQAHQAHTEVMNQRIMTEFTSGSYLSLVRGNLLTYWDKFVSYPVIGFYLAMFGNILLGFAAGRANIFTKIDEHRRLFRQLLGWGLLAGILGGIGMTILRMVGPGKPLLPTNEILVPLLMPLTRNIQTLGLASFYVAAIALMGQRDLPRRVLGIFAPVGRMAVTNYLLQSVIAVFVFSGVGLKKIGNFSPWLVFCLPAVVFALQLVCSRYWLLTFHFGPVEWVWRSLTYGKMQPLRKRPPTTSALNDAPSSELRTSTT